MEKPGKCLRIRSEVLSYWVSMCKQFKTPSHANAMLSHQNKASQ